MNQMLQAGTERTSADDVFDYLYDQINALKLLPGARISEGEIARQFERTRHMIGFARVKRCNSYPFGPFLS